MDEAPLEWRLIHAARYLGVAPWDLLRQPAYWTNWAFTCENAETEARNDMLEKAMDQD